MTLSKFYHDIRFGVGIAETIRYWGFDTSSTTDDTPRRIAFNTAAPTGVVEAWSVGDLVIDTSASGTRVGWRCTVAGAPGTWVEIGTSGSGAPTDATYVTLSTNATLTDERVLTEGSGIEITDAGAGSTVTVAVDETTGFQLTSIPRISPLYTGDATAGVLTDNATHAIYLGRASMTYSSPVIHFWVPLGGTGGPWTWGEVAVATGTPTYNGNPSLTTQFWGDWASVVNANTGYSITLSNSPGSVNRGDHVWLLIGCNDTARPNIAQGAGAVRAHGLIATATTTRPSTMAANTVFTAATTAPFALFLTEA